MINYRTEVLQSWVQSAPSVRDLANLLNVSAPFGLRALIARLRSRETMTAPGTINTNDGSAINGQATIQVSSDGSYVFSGDMRATGLPSYHYGVQVWVNCSEGAVIAAQRTGDVYGTDSSGSRQDNWTQPGTNPGVKLHWNSLRQGVGLGGRMDANLTGVLGTALDILMFAVKGILANAVIGPAGWLVLIGSELGDIGVRIATPDVLAGVLAAGATLLIVGPFGLVPAIVAGVVTADLTKVRHRSMTSDERAFADQVFMGYIDYDRVTLTNLSHNNGRKFTMPSIDNSILVNLDDAFDNPMTYQEGSGSDYAQPGSVFIHELTHAWQITNNSFVGVLCGMSSNYDYYDQSLGRTGDTSWPKRAWNSFNNEQQAKIVNEWYGAYVVADAAGNFVINSGVPATDLNGFAAVNDPAFHFIRDNIRTGTA